MKRKSRIHPLFFLLFAMLAVAMTFPVCKWIRGAPLVGKHPVFSEQYGYGSAAFDVFVKASYDELSLDDFQEFYRWMDLAYGEWKKQGESDGTHPFPAAESSDLKGLCAAVEKQLSSLQDTSTKVQVEMSCARGVHRMVKSVISRFSLQRGYEFTSVPRYGERQCFLQSVLIAGLLQQMGMKAGLVMVYRNEKGEESNNGHAVVLLRLSDEHDLIVDASESRTFATHQGLFCNDYRGNRYVKPVYTSGAEMIVGYQQESDDEAVERETIAALDIPFIKSQFDVYRGEWVNGALHSARKSREGLESAVRFFRRSVNTCRKNPLALYLLARSLEELNSNDEARQQFRKAYELYSECGWVYEGQKEKMKKYHIKSTL
ncbi:MAG: tetratricopeptide repeat protein [Vulcanimicrobiota bacterium]